MIDSAKGSSSLNLLPLVRFKVLWITDRVKKKKSTQKQDSPHGRPLLSWVQLKGGSPRKRQSPHSAREAPAEPCAGKRRLTRHLSSGSSVGQLPREGGELGRPREVSKRQAAWNRDLRGRRVREQEEEEVQVQADALSSSWKLLLQPSCTLTGTARLQGHTAHSRFRGHVILLHN